MVSLVDDKHGKRNRQNIVVLFPRSRVQHPRPDSTCPRTHPMKTNKNPKPLLRIPNPLHQNSNAQITARTTPHSQTLALQTPTSPNNSRLKHLPCRNDSPLHNNRPATHDLPVLRYREKPLRRPIHRHSVRHTPVPHITQHLQHYNATRVRTQTPNGWVVRPNPKP